MNRYIIWYVYRDLNRQIYVKGNLVANEIWWNISGWGEIWCIKRGRGYKQKGNDFTIFSPSNSESNKWLIQMYNKYPYVKLLYLPLFFKKVLSC